jgi:predicted acylesterase/phospholipase RssA/tetratricopeptide (TPR) repeat protein
MFQSTSKQNTNKELIEQARSVLGGQSIGIEAMKTLAKGLNNLSEFSYARKLYNRMLALQDTNLTSEERLFFAQKHALNTYKDTTLPADQRFQRALSILDKADNLEKSRNRETLGLAGAIYKRLWEVEGGRENLEKSYAYYRRGTLEKVDFGDSPYYTHINSAYLLDLLADLEEQALDQYFSRIPDQAKDGTGQTPADARSGEVDRSVIYKTVISRREEAASLRRTITQNLEVQTESAPGAEKSDKETTDNSQSGTQDCGNHYKNDNRDFWMETTLAEAYFGLGNYDGARNTIERALKVKDHSFSKWQLQSFLEQQIKLAQLIDNKESRQLSRKKTTVFEEESTPHQTENKSDKTESLSINTQRKLRNDCLRLIFEYDNQVSSSEALDNLYTGKIGLALSGGGFRASLFHIGVLAKLADLGILNRLEAVSCVSGGSIIGAHYFLELCRLYSVDKKIDKELNDTDYVGIVKNLERDFLEGIQKNIRTRVIGNLFSNIRMIFSSRYSRTMRLGELYEKHIYSRVKDHLDHKPRWIDDMKIMPVDEHESFNPKRDNWRRKNKIPIMILNATSLNTGHVWQFTASYMGEPPASINSEIDASYRLRRMYYQEAPGPYRDREDASRRIRLGYAVAASSCVPGMFEPLSLPGLYPDKTVQLVDGGVFDNQGIASLLEQDCAILLVSDASGQMVAEDEPKNGVLNVIKRSSSISQERIRWAQHRELVARKSSGRLKGLMFIHLKKDLGVDPQDWIDCPDPHDSTEDARPPELRGPITRYGVRKDLQQLLSAVRTDLDSFSEGEAYALMASGYLMTEHQFADCQHLFPEITDEKRLKRGYWHFLDYQETLKTPGLGDGLKKVLSVSSSSAFKIWTLSKRLSLITDAVPLLIMSLLVGTLIVFIKDPGKIPVGLWGIKLVTFTIGNGVTSKSLLLGWVIAAVYVYLISRLVESKIMKLAKWQNTLLRFLAGVFVSVVGVAVSWFHIAVFDKLYLWSGKTHRVINISSEKCKSKKTL